MSKSLYSTWIPTPICPEITSSLLYQRDHRDAGSTWLPEFSAPVQSSQPTCWQSPAAPGDSRHISFSHCSFLSVPVCPNLFIFFCSSRKWLELSWGSHPQVLMTWKWKRIFQPYTTFQRICQNQKRKHPTYFVELSVIMHMKQYSYVSNHSLPFTTWGPHSKQRNLFSLHMCVKFTLSSFLLPTSELGGEFDSLDEGSGKQFWDIPWSLLWKQRSEKSQGKALLIRCVGVYSSR